MEAAVHCFACARSAESPVRRYFDHQTPRLQPNDVKMCEATAAQAAPSPIQRAVRFDSADFMPGGAVTSQPWQPQLAKHLGGQSRSCL